MAQRSLAHGNSRYRLGHAERSVPEKRERNITGDFERKCFEFDRKIVVGTLDALRGAINESATQIGMFADERIFDESLARSFSRTTRHLNRMVSRLEKLLTDVASATGYPKIAPGYPPRHAVVRRIPNRS